MTARGICEPGTVAGFDGQIGYVHGVHLEEHPRLVPLLCVGDGAGFWNAISSRESRLELRWGVWPRAPSR